MKRVNDDLKSGQFKQIYLLYGEETYLRQDLKRKLKNAIAGEDTMNFLQVNGQPRSPEALKDFTDALPFFHDTRMVLLEDTGLFKSSSEGYDTWLENLPPHARVVFSEQEIDKRNRMYKLVSKIGYAAECAHPDEKQIGNLVMSALKRDGIQITQSAYQYVIQSIGNDMSHIVNEVKKLCAYAAVTKTVELNDAQAIITPSIENRIFEMTEAAARGDRKRTMELYEDLLALKEAPLRILFLLGRELNQLYITKQMKNHRKSNDEIAAALNIRPFVVNKLSNLTGRFDLTSLRKYVELAADLEQRVKSGDLQDHLAPELLIFSLTGEKK